MPNLSACRIDFEYLQFSFKTFLEEIKAIY